MNFRTQVELPEKEVKICHSERIMLWGSCFVENIGKLLQENKFRCVVNPLGILYNPISIAESLQQVLAKKVYEEKDLFQSGGMWHSWMHHSDFSSSSLENCLKRINGNMSMTAETLSDTDWLVVTWGTAYVYYLQQTRSIVGNCHKQSEKLFVRKRLEVDEIVEVWKRLLGDLRTFRPQLKVLFTVSPIRHAKDGMHGNQLSKSVLLLAIDELCKTCSDCYYFPSYEIVMDELRDYRFYADDMLHPSKVAVDYIWKRFSQKYFSTPTIDLISKATKLSQRLNHRPLTDNVAQIEKFHGETERLISDFIDAHPFLQKP